MKDLVIQAPSQGIAQSPHVGFGDMRNLDISSVPGVARLNTLTTKVSGTTVVGLPLWIVKNPATPAEVYALDNGGKVYKSSDSGATWALMTGFTSGGHGNGLAIWNNYLIVARDSYLDVCGDGTATGITNANWTNSWQAIDTDTDWHPMWVSYNDGKLYGGAGRYVFSIEELTTFAPGTSSTYTYTQQALDLPENYKIRSLTELGDYLMCGTWMGTSNSDFKVADIFPWDWASVSFGSPIRMNENGVNAMLNIGNTLYVFAGIEGKIYQCNGSSAQLIAQIPSSITNLPSGTTVQVYPGAVASHKGKVYFGLSSGASAAVPGLGVWSLSQTSKGSILNYEQTISTGNEGTSNKLYIGSLLSFSNSLLIIGWLDNTTNGIDKTDTNFYKYTSYGAYFESPFYQVGTPLIKRQFTEGEFQLATALTTGQGVKIKYRTDISSSYTTIGTYDFSTLGGVLSHNFTADIPDCEFLQVRVELTTGSSSATTPQFKSVSFR